MTSYLRLRLSKIQSQIWTLGTWSSDTWAFDTELLSREELTFAKSYREAFTCDVCTFSLYDRILRVDQTSWGRGLFEL